MTAPILIPGLLSAADLADLGPRVEQFFTPVDPPVLDHYYPMLYDVHERLRAAAKECAGVPVLPAYAVLTIYRTGGDRPRRGFTVRRSTWQIAVPIKQDGGAPMPMTFWGPNGENLVITPRLGDGVFISRGWEWDRDPVPESVGRFFGVAFHFVPETFRGEI